MPTRELYYSDLTVNPDNDRHGSLGAEGQAIEWLLTKRPDHMRNLAKDIAETGKIYEEPLILDTGVRSIVCDGNRRITCLKLLNEPSRAPTDEWQKFFGDLKKKYRDTIPQAVICRVEADEDLVDEILYRRHTGSQKGVGQSQWDDQAKHNFIRRTGKHSKINLAQELEDLLKEKGYIEKSVKIPKSNLNRLLSGAPQRARVGIRVLKNQIFFTHTPEECLSSLRRISNDLIDKKIVLGQIWNDEDKSRYLNSLAKDGFLPDQDSALVFDVPFADYRLQKSRAKPTPTSQSPIRTNPAHRKTLIPQDTDAEIPQVASMLKIREIWWELQNELEFSKHCNAISVLFRVLLELSLDQYIMNHGMRLENKNHLSHKMIVVAGHQVQNGTIDREFNNVAIKFSKNENIISAHTMNRYVHGTSFSPSPEHLRAMWNTLQVFIINCLTK
ncbi:MAG: hypothetical protein P1U88_21455 [Thalassobaculaceae bacterium]|nr:hypothetical protein [Thalassobaculaceae bacterium]